MVNKKTIIILCCIIFIVFLIIVFRDNIIRFKLSTRLNYHENVAYIKIKDARLKKVTDDDIWDVEITDRKDIEKIIKYLNSLKLIEDNPTEYEDVDLDQVGYFEIGIFRDGYENDSDAYDWIVFQTNYLAFVPSGHDWKATRYYIKNSGYDSKTQNSKTFKFLYDLINKSE